MVFARLDEAEGESAMAAEVVTLHDGAGESVAARLIGPLAGDEPVEAPWRIAGRYRIDPDGEPLSSLVSRPVTLSGDGAGHDWGALGLPAGMETRVRPIEVPSPNADAALAATSSGQRLAEANRWLTIAPGDRVLVAGSVATVVAVDRRKRTAEVERDGEVVTVPLDALRPEETTA